MPGIRLFLNSRAELHRLYNSSVPSVCFNLGAQMNINLFHMNGPHIFVGSNSDEIF